MSRYIKIEVKDKSKFSELLQENDLILDKSTFLVYRWFMSEELFREMYGDYEEISTEEVKPIAELKEEFEREIEIANKDIDLMPEQEDYMRGYLGGILCAYRIVFGKNYEEKTE